MAYIYPKIITVILMKNHSPILNFLGSFSRFYINRILARGFRPAVWGILHGKYSCETDAVDAPKRQPWLATC